MRNFAVACIVLFAVFSGASSFASNSVNITGNLKVDGYLMINVNWVVDTAKYAVKENIQQSVYDDIWDAVMPKLVKNVGEPSKCAQSRFTKVAEEKKLVKQRPNGSKVYDYHVTIKFECNTGIVSEKSDQWSPESFSDGFHYGFSTEANLF